MNIHEEFEEFLRLLAAEKVEFVVVGGYAVAFYGHVRTTQDLDLFFRNTERNVRKILAALRRFGVPADDSAIADFRDPGSIIRLGVAPVRVEMINAISGFTFARIWRNRVPGMYGTVPVHYSPAPIFWPTNARPAGSKTWPMLTNSAETGTRDAGCWCGGSV